MLLKLTGGLVVDGAGDSGSGEGCSGAEPSPLPPAGGDGWSPSLDPELLVGEEDGAAVSAGVSVGTSGMATFVVGVAVAETAEVQSSHE